MTPQEFINRWRNSAGAELANSQTFLIELCQLLGVPQPEPTQADEELNVYTFEKAVIFENGDGTTSRGRVDLYRRGCFVLESKQGSERRASQRAELLATVSRNKRSRAGTAQRGTSGWDRAMAAARRQAESYAKALPEWPPFLIVVDVGYCFDLYADFSGTGKRYQPFPDPQNYRIKLEDLADDDVRDKLCAIWLNPHALDPSKRSAKVTRELAERLAQLAKSLEEQTDAAGRMLHQPDEVAQFLMRCLFTMFAEDVELIPKDSFTNLLESLRETPQGFAPTVEALWRDMNTGTKFSPVLRAPLQQFNGGLFETPRALPLNRDQLELLIEAAHAQWRDVEPAIFGTLLERALDPHERHKLGAHYTPRAYVERLVMPTIIEPLRQEWDETYAAARQLQNGGDTAGARRLIREFHERLCEIRVLDPACGSGNFLYVSLELMKRLEGEVLNALLEFGEQQLPLLTINPHQFLGIEVNPRAAAITDLVLWIGYLQWHYRTRGNVAPPEPIIRKFHNIECRDAVLTWDAVEVVTDENGQPITRWDGRTTKWHPATGEEVPDETARVAELRYINPRKAEWPQADYIVGNPPFVGEKKMRHDLGDCYVEALQQVYSDCPSNIDYVMYWWDCAAQRVLKGEAKRIGLITTKSITQSTNRVIVDQFLRSDEAASIVFAIPNHPWVDNTYCAAVRIAMSVAERSNALGRRLEVAKESRSEDSFDVEFNETIGRINSDFRIGVNIRDVHPLASNRDMCLQGVKLVGPRKRPGFQLTHAERNSYLSISSLYSQFMPLYIAGKDITERVRNRFLIDFFGLTEDDARQQFPEGYQRLLKYVQPFRATNKMKSRREYWWQLGVNAPKLRKAMIGLNRIILTSEVAEHRTFHFFDTLGMLPDGAVAAIPSADALLLGVLSSRISICWAVHAGGRMGKGDTPRYQNGPCFDPFPFPDTNSAAAARIRDLAEQLDAHRKRQQELHPDLTMTGMYNVLEKLRTGEPLTKKEQEIHEKGLVSVLKQIHDDLDAAVFDAYGWPHDLTDEEILERLVALNHERAEEERRGIIRWLRPDFQNPSGTAQPHLAAEEEETALAAAPKDKKKKAWPAKLPEQVRALRLALAEHGVPASADELARRFTRARKATVAELLETLVQVGQARLTDDGRYTAA